MADDLDFDADEFSAWPLARRVRLCIRLAARAQAIAATAPIEHQKHYLLIADEWVKLAKEMQEADTEAVTADRRL